MAGRTKSEQLQASLAHQRAYAALFPNGTKGLKSLIALGLYMEAEAAWCSSQALPPSQERVDDWHDAAVTEFELEKVRREAEMLLDDFGDELVRDHEKRFMKHAVAGAIEAVHGTKKAFSRGASEAVIGALCWTGILIVISIVAHRAGIDLLAVYKEAAGTSP